MCEPTAADVDNFVAYACQTIPAKSSPPPSHSDPTGGQPLQLSGIPNPPNTNDVGDVSIRLANLCKKTHLRPLQPPSSAKIISNARTIFGRFHTTEQSSR